MAQAAHQFDALLLVDVERGGVGAAGGQVGGIDMPACIGATREDDVYFGGADAFLADREAHLRMQRRKEACKQQQSQGKGFFHAV